MDGEMPLTGWLAGRFGIKYLLLISVGRFTLASALCGSATSLSQLVAFRLLQGVCGAGLVPLSQSVLMQINPPERHGQAIAVWAISVMLSPIFGPMLSGWLTENYSWRWIFYINLPVGIIAFLGILVFIREARPITVPLLLLVRPPPRTRTEAAAPAALARGGLRPARAG